jgi:hypothetical protein
MEKIYSLKFNQQKNVYEISIDQILVCVYDKSKYEFKFYCPVGTTDLKEILILIISNL